MSLSPDDRAALIEIVRDAARTEILPRFRNLAAGEVAAKGDPQDLVTEADLRAEARMTAAIRDAFPAAEVIGEEAVAADPALLDRIAGAEVAVILDPVDGTWNFAKGLSVFGVILAVTVKGETVFGLLYDPINDDWIWAGRGQGCFHATPAGAERRLVIDGSTAAVEGLSGFVSLFLFPPEDRPGLAATYPDFARIHALRCSCHEYRMMAQGHMAFMLNGALKPWDHAAGVLAVQEAGAHVALMDGRPYSPAIHEGRLLIAPDAAQWDSLRARFAEALGQD